MAPPANPSLAALAKPCQPPPAAPAASKKDDDPSEEDLALEAQLKLYVVQAKEDLALKEKLKLYVLQAQDSDPGVQKLALDRLRQEIRSATSSTPVPKPLRFLLPHFGTLKSYFETMPASDLRKYMADILSVLALTVSIEGERESLKYRLLGSEGDIGSWGHEYVRSLAGDVAQELRKHQDDDLPIKSLMALVQQIVSVLKKHNNVEPEATMEGEDLCLLGEHVDATNYERACLYLTSSSKFLCTPDDMLVLDIAYTIYMKFGDLASASRIALHLVKISQHVKQVCTSTTDLLLMEQFSYLNARHGLAMETDDERVVDDCENEVMEPKSPGDVYKDHLIDGRGANLAATSVNASANAGFGQDKWTTPSSNFSSGGSSGNWLFRKKEHEASLAMSARGRTPSPIRPLKRLRGSSTPPAYGSDQATTIPYRRSSSSPPSPDRARGQIMHSEEKAMSSGSSGHTTDSKQNCQAKNVIGPVSIFWDMENCPVPKGVAKDVYCHVMTALSNHHFLTSDVTKFCAYGNLNAFSSILLEDLKSTGIQLIDISIRKKDAADKAILKDMCLFALDNPVPATIMLISGDVDFAPTLQGLRERCFCTVLAIPSVVHVSSDLTLAGDFVWLWPSIVRGRFVDMPRSLVCPGDLETLKREMIYLLHAFNEHLQLARVPNEYRIMWQKPLILSHYGVAKLSELIEKLGDPIRIWGRHGSKTVHLMDGVDLLQDQGGKSNLVIANSSTAQTGCIGYVPMIEDFNAPTNGDLDTPRKDVGKGHLNDNTEQGVSADGRASSGPRACDSRNLPRRRDRRP